VPFEGHQMTGDGLDADQGPADEDQDLDDKNGHLTVNDRDTARNPRADQSASRMQRAARSSRRLGGHRRVSRARRAHVLTSAALHFTNEPRVCSATWPPFFCHRGKAGHTANHSAGGELMGRKRFA
jgi:hypothetical protein